MISNVCDSSGLTEFDLRLATALIHSRYRGVFSSMCARRTDDGRAALEVRARGASGAPRLRLERRGMRLLATEARRGVVASSDTLEGLMEELCARLPPRLPV